MSDSSTHNPFAPPRTPSGGHPQTGTFPGAWERWRLPYQLVIVGALFIATGPGQPQLLSVPRFWFSACLVWLAANGLFSLGHLCRPRNSGRRLATVFTLLSGAALLLAILSVAAEMYPGI